MSRPMTSSIRSSANLPEPTDRAVTPRQLPEDAPVERSLRPRRLAEYIGQERVKETLQVFIDAAKQRGETLDHVLFYGPPGLGKTTLATIIAVEMGVSLRITSGPAIERQGDLVSILTNLKPGDVLFIDEIHRLNRAVEEVLYSAMEDFVVRSAQVLDVLISDEGARALARRARGTPRVANRLLQRARDYAEVRGQGSITDQIAADALDMLDIDHLGLDDIDRRILRSIVEKFGGGPVGIDTLAAAISEETDTVMDVYEPYLIQLGFLQRTPRGRVATEGAYSHLGIEVPTYFGRQPALFGGSKG